LCPCKARGLNIAARRGAPIELSRGAFAPCKAQGLNLAAIWDAPPEKSKGRNTAATRGEPKESKRKDSVAGTAHIFAPPSSPPRTEWYSPPIPPQATTRPLLSSQVPWPEGAVLKSKLTLAICKLTYAVPLLLDHPPFIDQPLPLIWGTSDGVVKDGCGAHHDCMG